MEKIKLTLDSVYPYGKWKGVTIKQMLDENDYGNKFSVFGRGDGYRYLYWVNQKCDNIELGKDILKKMEHISSERSKNYVPEPSRKGRGRLEHWNDTGSMTDISFQDIYGDFG